MSLKPTEHFVACAECGKERPIKDFDPPSETWRYIMSRSLCEACEMEAHKQVDSCPETIILEHGVSGCRLTWQHSGRCEPHVMPDDLRAVLQAKEHC